jgi:hypothetical protein
MKGSDDFWELDKKDYPAKLAGKILEILRQAKCFLDLPAMITMRSRWYCKIAVSYNSLTLHDYSLSR